MGTTVELRPRNPFTTTKERGSKMNTAIFRDLRGGGVNPPGVFSKRCT